MLHMRDLLEMRMHGNVSRVSLVYLPDYAYIFLLVFRREGRSSRVVLVSGDYGEVAMDDGSTVNMIRGATFL